MKDYSSLATAKKAIDKAGLSGLVVRYDYLADGRVRPAVLCDLREDVREVNERGFKAELKPDNFIEGATVFLKPTVRSGDRGTLAVIQRFVPETEGGVYLDRPLGGTRWWNISDLDLVEREED